MRRNLSAVDNRRASHLLRIMLIALIAIVAIYVFTLFRQSSGFSAVVELVLGVIFLAVGFLESWGMTSLGAHYSKGRSVGGTAKLIFVAGLALIAVLSLLAFWYLLSTGIYDLPRSFALGFAIGAATGAASLARSILDL